MAIIKEAYSSARVNLIYQLLKNEAEAGHPKDFDVRVDDLKVISRNTDPEKFHNHEEFVLPDTKSITINIYDGKSNRCNRYQLMLSAEAPSNEELSGIERSMDARITQERKKWEYDQLKKDYEDCVQRLRECEEHAEDLKEQVAQLENEKNNNSGQIKHSLINLAGELIKNPETLSSLPIIGSLFGGKQQPAAALNGPKEECLCSTAPTDYTGELTKGDDMRMKMALVPYFKKECREKVMKVMVYYFQDNHLIDQTITGIEALMDKNKAEKQAA